MAADLRVPPQAESFASWLAARRCAVRSLSISTMNVEFHKWIPLRELRYEAFEQVETALLKLAGGPLHQLKLELCGRVEVR